MKYVIDGLTGRLGNRMLQHIDAFSYAEKSGLEILSLDRECRPYLKSKKVADRCVKSIKRNWRLSESVFCDCKLDLKSYFSITKESFCMKPSGVAIHFRGTDFAKWKSHSIIDCSFFVTNVERHITGGENLYLVTDDPSHPNVIVIINHFESSGVKVVLLSGTQHNDFVRLIQCRIIVASPSTFSLVASLLGGGEIIYPKCYAMIEKENGSLFWSMCIKGEVSPYVNISLK